VVHPIFQRDVGEVRAACPVPGVVEAGMVGLRVDPGVKRSVRDEIGGLAVSGSRR
jgi:hypothetical protein